MATKKEVRWMETPWGIELIKCAVQNGKLVASFGKHETIARKALLDVAGESRYVVYNDDGEIKYTETTHAVVWKFENNLGCNK